MKIDTKQLRRMLDAVIDQVNDEREIAVREELEYTDPMWPDEAQQNTERGFLFSKLEEMLYEINNILAENDQCTLRRSR